MIRPPSMDLGNTTGVVFEKSNFHLLSDTQQFRSILLDGNNSATESQDLSNLID